MRVLNPSLAIDLAALCANYRRLAETAPNAAAAGVVKCDAYGLGAEAVGRALFFKERCRTFFVAYAEEGASLRKALGPDAEILVFNGPFEGYLSTYREFRLTPILNTIEQASLWAREMPTTPAAIHVDTGMNRLGMSRQELEAVCSIKSINLTLIMSHLACASDGSHPMNARQLATFSEIAMRFPKARKSLASSGGALIGDGYSFDTLRLGVGLYGVNPRDHGGSVVLPVATLTAPVIQIRDIEAGETVGYGAAFAARRKSVLATVAIGYGDGLPRSGSNRLTAHLGGVSCPIAGRVSMDLIVLDATDASVRPQIGDRAEFFGRKLPVETAAEAFGTIGYELLTNVGGLARPRPGLGGRVHRRYLWDGAPAPESLVGAEGK